MKLEASSLACGYGARRIVDGISFTVSSGEVLCILGPNGVGKTTLFKSILGLQPLMGGRVAVDGEDIAPWSPKRFAQVFGYVPQSHTPPFPYTVLDVVLMGRTAHLGPFTSPSPDDRAAALATMRQLHIEHLARRTYTEISGGERQMVLIARALVQEPRFLVMDEPTASLDFGNQARVLARIRDLARAGLGIVLTSHSPDQAFLCATTVALLGPDGFLIGRPDEIVTAENLERVYRTRVRIVSERDERGAVVKSCIPVLDD